MVPIDFAALAAPVCGATGAHWTLARAVGAGFYTAMHPQDRGVLEFNHDMHDRWYFDAVGLVSRGERWDNRRNRGRAK